MALSNYNDTQTTSQGLICSHVITQSNSLSVVFSSRKVCHQDGHKISASVMNSRERDSFIWMTFSPRCSSFSSKTDVWAQSEPDLQQTVQCKGWENPRVRSVTLHDFSFQYSVYIYNYGEAQYMKLSTKAGNKSTSILSTVRSSWVPDF